MTSNRSSAHTSPSRGRAGTPGSSSAPAPASDRQTHSTHIFDLPYRKAPEAERSGQPRSPASHSAHPSRQPSPSAASNPNNNNKVPPKITPIPRIVPSSSLRGEPSAGQGRSPSKPRHEMLAQGLEGKYIDEFGNILDWDGTVMGRVEGDLPSMVGRPVSHNGEILDTDGEVAGYVSDNYIQPERQELGGGLQVDSEGNIYDQEGAVVGKLNQPPRKEAKTPSSEQERDRAVERSSSENGSRACSCAVPAAPKPPSAPNPSEIYLDVKSTFDGIQLIIKIPTIFNRDHDCAAHDKEKTQEEKERYEESRKEDDHNHQ